GTRRPPASGRACGTRAGAWTTAVTGRTRSRSPRSRRSRVVRAIRPASTRPGAPHDHGRRPRHGHQLAAARPGGVRLAQRLVLGLEIVDAAPQLRVLAVEFQDRLDPGEVHAVDLAELLHPAQQRDVLTRVAPPAAAGARG